MLTRILIATSALAFAACSQSTAQAPETTASAPANQNSAESQSAVNGNTVVDIASEAGSFNTLGAAIQAAGLGETLSGDGPFTVFAPTDDAFAKLPEGTVEALLQDSEKLTAILTYHVVPGKVMASDVMGLQSAPTVQGQSLAIDTSNGVKVDNASVVKTDIVASNGVIHVIDTVLLPQ